MTSDFSIRASASGPKGCIPLAEAMPSHLAASPRERSDDSDRLYEMQRAFRATGGIVTGDWLTIQLRSRSEQPISLVARWIVSRQVISFEAQGLTWLPLFQFQPDGNEVTGAAQQVIGELRDVFDNWELTQWFGTPNTWLAGKSPADAIASDPQAVVQAARADRFVAAG